MDNKRFVELLELSGHKPRSYVGRGMYGEKPCVAVRGHMSSAITGVLFVMVKEKASLDEIKAALEILANIDQDGDKVYWKEMKWDSSMDVPTGGGSEDDSTAS